MEKYIGIIELRTLNVGSKSEGVYAMLVCDDLNEYTLVTEGVIEFNNPFFDPYDGKKVEVEAERFDDFLKVSEITVLLEEQEESCSE